MQHKGILWTAGPHGLKNSYTPHSKREFFPLARTPEAALELRTETLEKIQQGYARLVKWDNIKDNPPRNLKISPIAAIPHNSRKYHMILD